MVEMRTVEHPEYARRSARVLLLDSSDRLLLLNYGDQWFTPGGGVDQGETLREAAARELAEELGLVLDGEQLGPVVAVTSGYVSYSWIEGLLRDDYFLHRVTTLDVDPSGLGPHEVAAFRGYRWWTVEELATTDQTVYPLQLAPLLTELIAGRIPAEPVRLPWHH